MDFHAVGTFTLMVLLLTVMPGPNTALIVRTVPQNGRRAGIFNLAGIVSGFYIHGIFSILGLLLFDDSCESSVHSGFSTKELI